MSASYDARSVEARWSRCWERDQVYRAPDFPTGPKFYNYDSGPFPNGPLHMGHVRSYLLGDVTARYQRALGKCVLYCTEWDAFGLPNELGAQSESTSPAVFTQHWIETMERQMRTLGISYDWSRVRSTCDPAYYKWTQWLFLRLYEWKRITRYEAELHYCPSCGTTLAHIQVDEGRCWRCGTVVESRRLLQWFVTMSSENQALLASLDELAGWSPQIRALVRGLLYANHGRVSDDWLISRQRSWGTPIPIVHCVACGVVPVPRAQLPIQLPDDIDWSLGANALEQHPTFSNVECPSCDGPAKRETDTLDCFFDDVWCHLSPLVDLESDPSFLVPRVEAWLPIDRFHSGFDTVTYLHLHRYFGTVFNAHHELAVAEPIRGHLGHAMVLAGGRKMSKHLGNALSPSALIRRHGADAVRLAMIRAARPHNPVHWRAGLIDRAVSLLASVHQFFGVDVRPHFNTRSTTTEPPTRAAQSLRRQARRSLQRIGDFVDDYRPNAAITEWSALFKRTRAFCEPRIKSGRLSDADVCVLRELAESELIALSLFAPHLAEELWSRTGHSGYVVCARWPGETTS